MLPAERRSRIKQLILERQHMKISDLSSLLRVSEMTIHRDLKPLVEEGFIVKTFGGITLVNNYTNKTEPSSGLKCILCNRYVSERMAYRIVLQDNGIDTTCCAHCGLVRQHQLGSKVMQAICYDFLQQTTINANSAWYVLDTSLQIGCCHPELLTFELKDHAEKFVTGFGGTVYNFQEATGLLISKPSCHSH